MTPKLNVSMHAIERARERFDAKGTNDNVTHTLRSWFTRAVRKGRDNASGIIFDNVAKDVRMILDETCQTVLTVYRLSEVDEYVAKKMSPKLTVDRIANAVKREYKRMRTDALREIRKLKEEYAAIYVEIAQLKYNKIRCRAPHTQLLIQTRIDDLVAKTSELTKIIDAKLTEIEVADSEVKAVIGE